MISRVRHRGASIDELAVRLAGATEFAIDEIVRRRGDAVRTAVEVVQLQPPRRDPERRGAHASSTSAASCPPSQAQSRPCRAPSRASARPPRSARAWPTWSRSSTRRSRSSWPSRRPIDHDLDAYDDRAADVRVVHRAGCRRREASASTASELRRRQATRPARSRALRGSQPRARRARRQAHRSRARAHAARARDPVRRRRRNRRGRELQGDAPRGPHGAALLRLHGERQRRAPNLVSSVAWRSDATHGP